MVRTFLEVYMELCSSFLFLQEQIQDIIILLRVYQIFYGATLFLGGMVVTAPPFFDITGRKNVLYWHPDPKRQNPL